MSSTTFADPKKKQEEPLSVCVLVLKKDPPVLLFESMRVDDTQFESEALNPKTASTRC